MKLSHIPLRVATGAYILNSGLSKQGLEGQAAAGVHAMAAGAIPVVKKIPADSFAQLLSGAEIALGAALLAPFVSSRLAGAALTGFGRTDPAVPEDPGDAAGRQPQTDPGRHRPGQGRVAARRRPDAVAGPGPIAEGGPGVTMTPKTRAKPVAAR